MECDLALVVTETDRQVYHAIRRAVLWQERGRSGYDATHHDEYLPHHFPLLLKADGQGVGTVRLDDLRDGDGIVRLVAISAECRGRGLGRTLSTMVDAHARNLGIRILFVNAIADAEGFYRSTGWQRLVGARPLALEDNGDCVPMRKALIC